MNRIVRIFPIALRMARHRVGPLVAVCLAVMGGTSLITAAGVLTETGIRAQAPVAWLAEADVVVSAKQYVIQDEDFDLPLPERAGVPVHVMDRLSDLAGVAAVAGRYSVPVAAEKSLDATKTAQVPREAGSNWSFAMLGAPEVDGKAPATDDEIALSADSAAALKKTVGGTIDLIVAGEPGRYLVSAVVETTGRGVYLADSTAASLSGQPDLVDVIGVKPSSGADPAAVAEAVEVAVTDVDLQVTTGAARGDVAHVGAASDRGRLIAVSSSLSGTLVMTVGFIVSAAIAVSVNQQRRDLALLRATGATSGQIRRLIAVQATGAAMVALPVGVTGGYLLAQPMADLFTGAGLLPAPSPMLVSPLSGTAAALLVLIVVHVAASLAALRTSRLAATEAISESRTEPRHPTAIRTSIGYTLIGLSLTLTVLPLVTRSEIGFVVAASNVLLGIIGLALAGPAMVQWFTARQVSRSRSATAPRWLAVHNSHAYALRTAGAVTVLALAIALAVVQVFTTTTHGAVIRADIIGGSHSAATLTAPAVGGVSESTRKQLVEVPEVTAAVGIMDTALVWTYRRDDRARAEGFKATAFGAPPSDVVDLAVVDGDIGRLTGDTIAMDAERTWLEGLAIGDRVTLLTGGGVEVRPTLVATYQRGFGFGMMVTTTELATGNNSARLYDSVLVNGDRAAIDAWASMRPDITVRSSAELAAASDGITGERRINLTVTMALLAYVVLAGANNLITATSRRRAELALLRLVGATPSQIRAMMRTETRLICFMAGVAGLALSVPAMTLLSLGFLNQPWPEGPPWVILAVVATTCLVAYPAIMAPVGQALRRPSMESLAVD